MAKQPGILYYFGDGGAVILRALICTIRTGIPNGMIICRLLVQTRIPKVLSPGELDMITCSHLSYARNRYSAR